MLYTDALIQSNGKARVGITDTTSNGHPSLTGRFYYGDLTLTFSRPVSNPVIHIADIGGRINYNTDIGGAVVNYVLGFTTDFKLTTPGLTLSKLSGTSSLTVTADSMYNNAALIGSPSSGETYAGQSRIAASGSVVVLGTNITTVTFRLKIRGDGGSIRNSIGTTGGAATATLGNFVQWAVQGSFQPCHSTPNCAPAAGLSLATGDYFQMAVGLKTPVTVSGNVWHDSNGGNVNSSSAVPIPSGIYANLIDNNGLVVASQSVPTSTGVFSFTGVGEGSYTVVISTTQGVQGEMAPTASPVTGWTNTGEFNGASNTGNDGNINGRSEPFTVASTNVQDINFGIQLCAAPSGITLAQTAPTCTGSTSNNNGKITLTAISNANKFGVSTGTTYSGPAYSAATAIGTLPKDLQTAIPNAGETYTIRFFNGSGDCFKDTTVTVASVFCFVQGPIVCGMRIDSLSAYQESNVHGRVSSTQSTSVLLGGERDMNFVPNVPISQTNTRFEVGPYFAGGTALDIANQAAASSTLTVQWDGIDNDPVALDHVGLGGLDFAALNIDRIKAEMSADFPSGTNDSLPIVFELYTNSGAASKISKNFKFATNTLNIIEFEFDKLVPFIGAGVDLSDIGAIVMFIDMGPNSVSTRTGWDVFIRDFSLECATCTQPTAINLTQTAPTCTGGTPNNDGKITLTTVTNADKFGVSAGATYSGTPDYAAATAIGSLPLDLQTNTPNTGGTYTIRFFNGGDACYKDSTVTVAAVVCCEMIIASATPSACDPSTNTYSLTVVVNYSNPPTGNISLNSSAGSLGSFAQTGSPQTIVINNLTANGTQDINVSAEFVNNSGCSDVELAIYDAPAACTKTALGNFVFMDVNADGNYDAGTDMGVDGVVVQLFLAGQTPGGDAPQNSTTTSGGGFYLFDQLDPGTYFVFIPSSEFAAGEPLNVKISSAPEGGDNANDDNSDENGQNALVAGGVKSSEIALSLDGEPTAEAGQGAYSGTLDDDNVNMTLDFGFVCTAFAGADVTKTCPSGGGAAPASHDFNLTGTWSILSQPVGASAAVSGGGAVSGMTLEGEYDFQIIVNGCTDTVKITVPACCPVPDCVPVKVSKL